MSVDKDEETARAERDKEAAQKRQQNALPKWHLSSTISGDLTALGIKESARAEADAATEANRLPSSNDAILKGLSVSSMSPPVANGDGVKPSVAAENSEMDCMYFRHLKLVTGLTLAQTTISITLPSQLLPNQHLV